MVTINQLKNGIRVVLEELPYVRSISFGIWVLSGSCRELPEENGISHFIEHMVFKGTDKRSAKDIAEEMDAIGGQVNAYTTKEYTCFHTRVLDKHLDQAMDVMSDMFLHSRFSPEDIQKERNVILEEVSMYQDTPDDLVHEQLQCAIWQNHGLGMSILGTEESLHRIQKETFTDYMSRHYLPKNTVIALAGNFQTSEILEKLEQLFGCWNPVEKTGHVVVTPAYRPSVVKTEKDIEQLHLLLAFPSLPRDHKLKYALSVFNTYFGGGMSSFLFQNIREEKGLTYSVYSYNSAFQDTGLFAIYAGMNPNQFQVVKDLIFEEIDGVKTKELPPTLLQKTKEQIISNFIIGNESTSNRMSGIGGSVLLRGRVQDVEETIAGVEAVTPEDIAEVTKIIFQPENMSISAVASSTGIKCVKS